MLEALAVLAVVGFFVWAERAAMACDKRRSDDHFRQWKRRLEADAAAAERAVTLH